MGRAALEKRGESRDLQQLLTIPPVDVGGEVAEISDDVSLVAIRRPWPRRSWRPFTSTR
jgi:hypothetical protein